jgi:hypothetical protein
MDKTTLVVPFSHSAGLALLQELVDEGFEIKAAYWLYLSEPDDWRLHIALPMYDAEGPKATYNAFQAALSTAVAAGKISDGDIDLIDTTAVSPKNPLARAVSKITINSPKEGYLISRSSVDGIWVDQAYVYRIPHKSQDV